MKQTLLEPWLRSLYGAYWRELDTPPTPFVDRLVTRTQEQFEDYPLLPPNLYRTLGRQKRFIYGGGWERLERREWGK